MNLLGKRSSLITLSEIVNDQIESGLWYDIDQRRQNLQRSLATAKHHQIVLNELFGKLKRAAGDVYQVLQLRLQNPEGENNSLQNNTPEYTRITDKNEIPVYIHSKTDFSLIDQWTTF